MFNFISLQLLLGCYLTITCLFHPTQVSYNAAGVLAHIASDGEEAWTLDAPQRRAVLDRLVRAVDRWDLERHRNINYRSFEPILRLVRVEHTEEVRYWAVWALANLTTVYREFSA